MAMFGPGTSPAFPRMSYEDATERVRAISSLPLSEVASLATTSVENSTYYQTAPTRVEPDDLTDVQGAVRRLAKQHGYPNRQPRGGSLKFDQDLTILLTTSLNILPADAADEGVWSFFTLNVCPEIALWRFPNDTDENGGVRENYERLIGRPRNIFRRAWWRGFVLGSELSSQLIEDESVGIMERPSIGGNRDLARLVARTHLSMLSGQNITKRQDLLREAMKRLRRRMGQVSIHTLNESQQAKLVEGVFHDAIDALQLSPAVEPARESSALEKFRELAPDVWHLLREHAVEVPWIRMAELREQLPSYRDANDANLSLANKITSDLEFLIQRWPMWTPGERAVVHAASAYFLLFDDGVPDSYIGGLDDDDEVVSAAFAALSQVRE